MKKVLILLIPFSLILFSCNSSKISEDPDDSSIEETTQPNTEVIKSGEMDLSKTYYKNGQTRTQGNLLKEKKEGKWVSFYEDGMPWSETWFINGQKHGNTTVWYKNGQKFYHGRFENNKEAGKWTYWDEYGAILKEVNY